MNSTKIVQTIVLLLVLDVLALMFGNFISTTNEIQTSIFTDDFEGHDVGVFPYAWELLHDGVGVGERKIVGSVSASSTESWRLYGESSWAVSVQQARTSPMTIIVPDDYPTIQQAINNANEGDTIFVRTGLYNENIVLDKALSLLGEGRTTTIIDGSGGQWTVSVRASNAAISGFTIRDGGKDMAYKIIPNGGVTISSNCTSLFNNIITDNDYCGVRLSVSIYANSYGNIVKDNDIVNNVYGISLDSYSDNNKIVGNNISSNTFGISIGSSYNFLRSNAMNGNRYSFGVYGPFLSNFIQDVDTTNTVDGKPIYYLVGERDKRIPPGAGAVVLVNSQGIILRNLVLRNLAHGVILANTTGSILENLTILNNYDGMMLRSSSNNRISNNEVVSNMNGIYFGDLRDSNFESLGGSNSNLVSNNNISNNTESVSFQNSDNNIVTGNRLSNLIGIYLERSNNNVFYHNFMNNTFYKVNSYESNSTWDNDYPSGGNYWSDYEERYPDAQELDDSGIWNTPYVIDESNQDNYPLMEPWAPTQPIVTATVDVDPDTLNLRSKGRWITAYIQLPEGYNPADIDATMILLDDAISPVLDSKYGFVTNPSEYLVDHNEDGILERMVKFDRATVQSWIYQSAGTRSDISLTITGSLLDGPSFKGIDTISIFWTNHGPLQKMTQTRT